MDALPLIPHLLALALSIVVGRGVALRIRKRDPSVDAENALKHVPHVWFMAAVTAVVCVAVYWLISRPIDVQAEYPLWVVDAAPIVLWAVVLVTFGYVFALTLTFAFETGHETRFALLLGAALAIAAVEVTHWQWTRPLWPELTDRRTEDGAILQTSGASCAAASGAVVAGVLGIELDEPTVARAMHTTAFGTSTGQMVRGMRELGIECTPFAIARNAGAEIPTPSIVFVRVSGVDEDGHAIAVLETDDDELRFVDPLSGWRTEPMTSFAQRWAGRGISCVVP